MPTPSAFTNRGVFHSVRKRKSLRASFVRNCMMTELTAFFRPRCNFAVSVVGYATNRLSSLSLPDSHDLAHFWWISSLGLAADSSEGSPNAGGLTPIPFSPHPVHCFVALDPCRAEIQLIVSFVLRPASLMAIADPP